MGNNIKKIQLKLNYDEEKLKAIKISLSEKGKDLDEEMLKFLDGLYQKNVPQVLKNYVENGDKV